MARQEDKAMEGLLRRSLARDSAVEPCPDAEILAAYFERSLAALETARYESHFARCPRCREQLALMTRVGEPAEAEGAPGVDTKEASRRMWGLGWNWLAPAAVLATFALVWFIRYRVQTGSTTHTWTQPMVQVIKQEPPVTGNTTAPPPPLPEVAMQAQPSQNKARKIQPPPVARNAPVKTPPALLVPLESLTKRGTAEPSNDMAMVAKEQRQAAASGEQPATAGPGGGMGYGMGAGVAPKADVSAKPSAPPAPSNPPNGQNSALELEATAPRAAAPSQRTPQPQAATGGAVARVETRSRTDQTVEATSASPLISGPQGVSTAATPQKVGASQNKDANALQNVEIAEDKSAGQQDFVKLKEADKKAATTGGVAGGVSSPNLINAQAAQISGGYVVFGTPAPTVVWRIAPDGFVEHSTDSGATWEGTLIKAEGQFLAGSAPTANTCWVVGRGGAIFMTSDSNTWKKIPPPALVDLVAVSAASASSATVTASDGRKFATVNGGKKWQLVH